MDRSTQPRPVPGAERNEIGPPRCRFIQDRCLQVSEPDDTLDGNVAETRRDRVQVPRALSLQPLLLVLSWAGRRRGACRHAGRRRTVVEEADDGYGAARDVDDRVG